MKNQSKWIIGLILLVAIAIYIYARTSTPSGFEWQDKNDGTWTKIDLGCMAEGTLTYTCVSNCYENKAVQLPNMEGTNNVWDLGYDKTPIKTNTGIEVICFDQGCLPAKDDQGIWTAICPTG